MLLGDGDLSFTLTCLITFLRDEKYVLVLLDNWSISLFLGEIELLRFLPVPREAFILSLAVLFIFEEI